MKMFFDKFNDIFFDFMLPIIIYTGIFLVILSLFAKTYILGIEEGVNRNKVKSAFSLVENMKQGDVLMIDEDGEYVLERAEK